MSDAPQKPPIQVGPIAAMVIIVLLFAIGGAYFFITQSAHIKAQQAAAALWQD